MQSFFIDSNETQQAVLGGGYLQNFISSGSVGKGFCVVSNKRVYFKGKSYTKSGSHYKSTKEEKIVALDDVTGTGFSMTKSLTALIWLFISFIFLIFMFITAVASNSVPALILGAIPIVVFLLVYLLYNVRIFEIVYAGGSITFRASNYSIAEIRQFQKDLITAKDAANTVAR